MNRSLERLWILPLALLAVPIGWAARPATPGMEGDAAPRSGIQERATERALVTLAGQVHAVELARDANGVTWVEAIIQTERGPDPVRIRMAPERVLMSEEFHVHVDDLLLIRAFSDETPLGAQCVRNRTTGRMLRLRCLHGVHVRGLGEAADHHAAAESQEN